MRAQDSKMREMWPADCFNWVSESCERVPEADSETKTGKATEKDPGKIQKEKGNKNQEGLEKIEKFERYSEGKNLIISNTNCFNFSL